MSEEVFNPVLGQVGSKLEEGWCEQWEMYRRKEFKNIMVALVVLR